MNMTPAPSRANDPLAAMACLAAVLLCTPCPGSAHDLWMTAERSPSTPGEEVTLRLRLGEKTGPEAVRFSPSRITRLAMVSADGERAIPLSETPWQVSLSIAPASPLAVAYESAPSLSELPLQAFDDYLREEHLTHVRAGLGVIAAPAREHFSRSLKALLATPDAALVDCPLGLPLEITLQQSVDGELALRATFEGEPVDALWIELRKDTGEVVSAAATDQRGEVRLAAVPGDWVAAATHMVHTRDAAVPWRSWWATTSFHLGETGIAPCTAVQAVADNP